GFDPTADSLTIGNLVPILMLSRFQKAGHTPVVIVGGATGRIGDPSGKDAERSLMTDDQVEANIAGQTRIYKALLGDDVEIIDNYSWFRGMGFIHVLREIGKHFSVNEMVRRDAVKNRLEREGQGISYTEFSYMLLQAYDFLHLFREHDVTIQCAGSDQWGNIVSGCELIARSSATKRVVDETVYRIEKFISNLSQVAREHGVPDGPEEAARLVELAENLSPTPTSPASRAQMFREVQEEYFGKAFGLVAPLLTKSDGGKFGKTEAGAIWLTEDRTSPYAFYQFWLNADDGDVERYLTIFTDLTQGEIADAMRAHAEAPHLRGAQKTLGEQMTRLVHGDAGFERAMQATQALFSGDVKGLDARTLDEAFGGVPSTNHDRVSIEGLSLVDLLPETSRAAAKREARAVLGHGAVSVNGEKADAERALTTGDLLHGSTVLLRRGKKKWHVCRWA
ncbi:MAG: tyrosine--tRNA ligase, partial [Planctomycetota bacterium]